jgi:hypothetical protein
LSNPRPLSIFRLLKVRKVPFAKLILTLVSIGSIHSIAIADSDDETTVTNSWTQGDARFGPFGVLDRRSVYFRDAFPQPLLVDDTAMEQEGEAELNYLHTSGPDQERSDIISVEGQKSFGVVTFELSVPYEWQSDSDDSASGVGNIELGIRSPIYQYVSENGVFDNTMGVGLEAGIPVNSALSKNAELEPGVFNDIALDRYFTIQTTFGFDKTFGSGDDGGSEDFDYGLAFTCTIPNVEQVIPGIERISPMFEITGELGLNEDEAGQNSVLGSAGFRIDFRPIGGLEPSLGLGYVFPMSSVARKDVHWGIVTSFTVEF